MVPPLERWLAPEPRAVFFARWLHEEALLLPAPGPPWPEVGLDEVETVLASAPPGTAEWIEGGVTRPAPASPWEEARRRKASLRLNRIHTLLPALGTIAHGLREELGEEIGANAYLSWDADSPGLAPHTDPYDVFVLQLTGRKAWFLDGFARRAPIDVVVDAARPHGTRGTLETAPGQLLYLPPGLRHRAQARSANEPSLHVTFAVRTKTAHSFVEWLASRLTAQAPEALLPRVVADEGMYRDHLEALRDRCDALLADPDEAARAFLAYRDGHEYERTAADLVTHRRVDARKDR